LGDRFLILAAALAGLLGVAGSAAAAHVTGGGSLETAARFLLIHAPALIGLSACLSGGLLAPRIGRIAAWLLIAGLFLFCGDLAARSLLGSGLVPMAAPTGGFLLMGGWLLVGVAALAARR
jgi:uncharacterized membrane protein YgdD (TMEM256/DUF423 family)